MNQRELPGMLAALPAPRLLPEEQIAHCADFRAALRLCLDESRVKRGDGDLARLVGIHPTQFSEILKKPKTQDWYLDENKIEAIELACGNHAMTQWLAYRSNLLIVQDSPEARQRRAYERRIAELESELKRRAA